MFGLKTKARAVVTQHVEELLVEYNKSKRAAAAAEARARAARTALAAVPAGTYGRWVLNWQAGRRVMDQARVADLLGDDTPYKTTDRVIDVKRVEES